MTHASLFSGIGGFDLAAEWMGWTNVFNCEWEEFPRTILKHHFPNAKQYGDVRDLQATEYRGRVDVLSGGFPCQPYSVAGKRQGKNDERHLWPEMLRVIRECTPTWVVGENVRGLASWNDGLVFEEVCTDLEASGYSVQPIILPACAVNAPHRRDRVWFIAYRDPSNTDHGREGCEVQARGDESTCSDQGVPSHAISLGRDEAHGVGHGESDEPNQVGAEANAPNTRRVGSPPTMADGELEGRLRSTKRDQRDQWDSFPTKPPVCGGNDGLPRELDSISFPKWRKESIKAYGNAVVPQVALQIFKAIEAYAQYPET